MENLINAMPGTENINSARSTLEQEAAATVKEVVLGLENLSLDQKISSLKDLLEDLKSDNKNRYIFRDISLVLEEFILDKRYEVEKENYRNIRAAHGMV